MQQITNIFSHLTTDNINNLDAYQTGKPIEELQRELGLNKIIKLASNESPLHISDSIKEALLNEFHNIQLYPDGSAYYLKEKIANKFNLTSRQITIGHGSSEIFDLLIRTFATGSNSEIIVSKYAFVVYQLIAQALGTKVIQAETANWSHDLKAIYSAITVNTKIIFITNPNNPTGTFISIKEIEEFLSQIDKNILVVLDEAYIEYLNNNHSLNLLSQYPNLVITRTFSKIYGLAALRIGYSFSHPDIADLINRIRAPFNTNHLAHIAAIHALDNNSHLENSVNINDSGKEQIAHHFKKLGIEYIESYANFISFKIPKKANKIYQQLLHKGIIIRPLQSYNMPDWLRVSIGLKQDNQEFLDALRQLLGK